MKTMAPSQSLLVVMIVALASIGLAQMPDLQDKGSFLLVSVGDNISLSCFSEADSNIGTRLYWYKQSLGTKPVRISSVSKYNQRSILYGEFQNNRFTLDNQNDKNDLHIKNIELSDFAIYYCVRCFLYENEFLESVSVIVKSLNSTTEVLQSPNEDTDPGRSVTLNCSVHTGSCDGAHRVYWFKQSEESAAGVLYSHGGSSDQCGMNTNSQTENSCVYNLPIHNASAEQTGTYYCAVASCGQVLFGNGTRVKIRTENGVDPIIYILSGALGVTSVLVVLLASLIKKKYNSLYTELKVQPRTSPEGQDPGADHLHYAALSINPSSRRQRSTAPTDCVYSGVLYK